MRGLYVLVSAVLWYEKNIFIRAVLSVPLRSITSLTTMNTLNTLQATSLTMEVNVIKIIFDSQTSLHPLCENHSSIYLFCEGLPAIQVDIQAHCQSTFGWGALHWIVNAQFPAGSQWTKISFTDANSRPKIGDIATLVHNKCLEECCIYNGKCACRNWVITLINYLSQRYPLLSIS